MGSVKLDRVPPQNVDAERTVLGAMMLPDENAFAIPAAMSLLAKEDFYRGAHQKVFGAIVDLYDRGQKVDLLIVTNELERTGHLETIGGISELDGMIDAVPTAKNIEYYAQLVREESIRRQIIHCSALAYNESFDNTTQASDVIDALNTSLLGITQNRRNGKPRRAKGLIKEAFRELEDAYHNEGIRGSSTGFPDLDKMTFGLQKGQYVIIAGRPSMGKSMFVQAITRSVAIDQKKVVLVFSLEMSAIQLVLRMLASESSVTMDAIQGGHLKDEDWPKLTVAAGKISEAAIHIDDHTLLTPHDMRTKIYQTQVLQPVDLIIVDYLQLCKCPVSGFNTVEQVGWISGQLKALAREFNIPLIAVSQLSRKAEERTGNRPMLSDLRQSGELEQDADIVMMLYREHYYDKTAYENEAELIIAKQRNGRTGTIKLFYRPAMMQFRSLARVEKDA